MISTTIDMYNPFIMINRWVCIVIVENWKEKARVCDSLS